MRIKLRTDASAAHGIAHRRGVGKVRHLETNLLWLQEKVGMGEITVEKVPGTKNVADALTKYIGAEEIRKHVECMGAELEEGRHPLMPEVGTG